MKLVKSKERIMPEAFDIIEDSSGHCYILSVNNPNSDSPNYRLLNINTGEYYAAIAKNDFEKDIMGGIYKIIGKAIKVIYE